MLSRNLEKSLHKALALANERNHEYATLEHLLLALTDDTEAVAVMRACGVRLDKLRFDLTRHLDEELSELETPQADAKPTSGFQRVLQRAVIHVQSSGKEEVSGADVLVSLFSERESHAVFFLQSQNMTRFDAVNYLSHGITKNSEEGDDEGRVPSGADDDAEGRSNKRGVEALNAYCVDLNKKAAKGKIDPLIGRGCRG